MNPYISEQKAKFEEVLEHLKHELSLLRTGRAATAMVENIMVPAYGSTMELRGVGTISVPDAKTITIDPWDKSILRDIEKAITDARIGANPVVDGTLIRISFPPLTEENRKQTAKKVHEKLEEARIALRKVREAVREDVLKREKDGKVAEDERFRMQDELEVMTKDYSKKLDEAADAKEKEVMTI